jgi:hypothetical protein
MRMRRMKMSVDDVLIARRRQDIRLAYRSYYFELGIDDDDISGYLSDLDCELEDFEWALAASTKAHMEIAESMKTKKQDVYLLIGAPCSGKTWITNRIGGMVWGKFNFVPHDECPIDWYGKAIDKAARTGSLPVLAEAPFRAHALVKELVGYGLEVHEIYVLVKEDILKQRYKARTHEMPARVILLCNESLWATFGEGEFAGDSTQVLEYLKKVAKHE